ncbi:hypothetical protein OCV99_02600 [Dorea acetigenes]|uniref:Uncharacterized protein n=1 Tax=Dorea acetigenes TaxID=2981787 RepID=A0ABT2RJB4_9FIRM|nr:hypothetical protein [Dorea acetigenes]MCU6685453.1 hypothetical protein [Dorea acetigenes]SCI52476.1 Uncharacterised protein [uncultured Clostridium sp.]
MKIEKGQPGYLKAERNKLLAQTLIEFVIVVVLLIVGYVQTGTKLNLFTLVAVLGCLPASKVLVELITIFPYKTIDADKAAEIKEKTPLLTTAYDMVLTSREKIMPVDAIVISGGTICGYSKSKKVKPEETASYIKKMLQENRFDKVTVKIFPDYVAFLSRAEGMNSIAEIEREDTRKKEKKIRKIILSLSM